VNWKMCTGRDIYLLPPIYFDKVSSAIIMRVAAEQFGELGLPTQAGDGETNNNHKTKHPRVC
jgi:hypothetical protein